MSVLENIEPKEVFAFFEAIAGIPHGSGNISGISDYLADFAVQHGLRYIQDELKNVIIFKPATPGYEDRPAVILQGHRDMVCEKEADCDIDMAKEPIRLLCDGKKVTADGTTLGGDDGIAVAYMLAILASDDIAHPELEAVFTVDEEIGMLGAAALDMSVLKGKKLLNIDSEDEGIFLCGCAGGATVVGCLPVSVKGNLTVDTSDRDYTKHSGITTEKQHIYRIRIDGLTSGHSGIEIDKGRANAIILMGRLLEKLDDAYDIDIIDLSGGGRDNVIPASAEAVIAVDDSDIQSVIKDCEKVFRNEYSITDPGLSVNIETVDDNTLTFMDDASKNRIIDLLRALPNGVQRMNPAMPGRVQTSLNIGILKTVSGRNCNANNNDINDDIKSVNNSVDKTDNHIEVSFLVRSDVKSEKQDLADKVTRIISMCGGTAEIIGDYPGWQFTGESELIDIMSAAFKEQYGYVPKVETVHAGVECGYFAEAIEGLDVVSFGPDLKGIHTPAETMDVESVRRTWKLITDTLKAC
ncbi:MAG: aminoacyl-histidine dipeptidase [Eubacterium sp.]|nr:aminoacyl-histidine dipeptidase [Eubacterium sp.]